MRRTIARWLTAGVYTVVVLALPAAPGDAAVVTWTVDTAWSSTNTALVEQTSPTATTLADDLDAETLPVGLPAAGLSLNKLAESDAGGGYAGALAGFALQLTGADLRIAGDTLADARTAGSTTAFPLTANASAAYRVLLTLTLSQALSVDFSAQLSTRASTTQFNLTAITGSLSEPVAGTLTSNLPTPPADRNGFNTAGRVDLLPGVYQLDVTGTTVLQAPSGDGPDLTGSSSIDLLLDFDLPMIPEPGAVMLAVVGLLLSVARRRPRAP